MQFELDVTDAKTATAAVVAAGGAVVETVDPGPAGVAQITIEAQDEATAFAVVNAVYGPDDGSRESNRFYVYGSD